ncbi:MAG: hypothetical protein IJS08_18355 [Victivallales bacterium]|nr:hypothetical protein [Victivallales bacterium]
MKKSIALFFCLATAWAFALPGAFTVEQTGDTSFKVFHRGKLLIESISATGCNEGDFGLPPIRHVKKTLSDGTQVWTSWSENLDTAIRQEIAVKGDGSEVEFTMIGEIPLYGQESTRNVQIKLPWNAINGCKYEGLLINGRQWTTDSGALDDKTPAKGSIGKNVFRYLVFSGGNAAASGVVFDFNPIGAGYYGLAHPLGGIRGVFSVMRNENQVLMNGGAGELSAPSGSKASSGVTGAKLVLREGNFKEDYPTHHAWTKYTYNDRLPLSNLYSFGSSKHGKMYTDGNLAQYDDKKGFGWLNVQGLSSLQGAYEGAFYSAVKGKDASFKIGNLPPGLHILQISCGNFGGESNNFSISANGRELVSMQSVAAKELLNIAVPVWATEGSIKVDFKGDFLVSAIGTAFLMAQAEDFTYKRGYWLVDGFEPSLYFHNEDAKPDAEMAISVDRIPMPVPGEEAKGQMKKFVREVELPDASSPGLQWTKRPIIRSVIYSAYTRDEALRDKLLQRRLDEVQKDGANTIMVGGTPILSRHTFPMNVERDNAMIEKVTKMAHQRGMKVIDHNDATLLWQDNVGFRQCAERLPELSRALPDMMPSATLCLMNPDFTRKYRDFLLDAVKRGVDAFQCDELYFYPFFCGCRHCREGFHKDTGWYLPLNELDKNLNNHNSPLWKAYLEWRKIKIADWLIGFRREASAINPNLVICRYNTHTGFSTTSSPLRKGQDLIEFTRVVNFFGTEIMPRNNLICARSLLPFRKMYNLLREASHTPLFAFLYGSHHDTKYFGWAGCNMAAQSGFIEDIPKDGEANFLAFSANPDNMDIDKARPTAQIALLFSQHSRDWNTEIGMTPTNLGIAQTLEELHIPYRVYAEFSLNKDKLKDMKGLIIGASACLSDENVNEIIAFAQRGGTVIMNSNAASCDELGNPRKSGWPFRRYFDFTPGKLHKKYVTQIGASPDIKQASKLLAPMHYSRPYSKGKTISGEGSPLYGFNARGEAFPLIFSAPCGKGKLICEASPLGGGVFIGEIGKVSGNPKWPYELDEKLAANHRKYLKATLGNASPWQVSAPTKVYAELYRQDKALVAHFLNGQGATMKKGQVYSGNPPGESWPPLKEDIQFTLKADGISQAYAVSPDFQGRKPLQFTRNGDSITIRLPKELLHAYTLVWMK